MIWYLLPPTYSLLRIYSCPPITTRCGASSPAALANAMNTHNPKKIATPNTPTATLLIESLISLIIYLFIKDKHFSLQILIFLQKSFKKVYSAKGPERDRPNCFERYVLLSGQDSNLYMDLHGIYAPTPHLSIGASTIPPPDCIFKDIVLTI